MEPGPSPLSAADQRSSSATSSSKRPSAEKNLRVLGPLKKTARVEAQAEARAEAQAAQAEHGFVYEQMADKSTWLEQPGRVGHSESDGEGELGQAPTSTALNYEQQKEQDRVWRRLLARRVESTAMSHFGRDDSRNAEQIGRASCRERV